MRLSTSIVNVIEQCNLRARWRRIDKAQSAPSELDEAARAGKAVHQALEVVYRLAQADNYVGPLHTPEWLGRAREAIDTAITEHGPFEDEERISDMRLMVLDYLLDQDEVVGANVLGIEQFVQLGLRKGTNVVGFLDRLDRRDGDEIAVIDYKTSWRRYDTDQLRAELQPQTYAVLVAKRHTWATRITFEMAELRHRTSASVMWTSADLPRLEQQVRERYIAADKKLQQGPWEPNRDVWCNRCEFKAWCPAWDGTPQPGTWNPEIEDLQPDPEH